METRSVECLCPADPADPETESKVLNHFFLDSDVIKNEIKSFLLILKQHGKKLVEIKIL